MRKFLKRTVIAGAAALAIMGVAQAESMVQQFGAQRAAGHRRASPSTAGVCPVPPMSALRA